MENITAGGAKVPPIAPNPSSAQPIRPKPPLSTYRQ